jgi:hypothetical protein
MSEMPRNAYDAGHLLVASIRVLVHRDGRPPTVAEAAAPIGLSLEIAHHLVRRLQEAGVLRAVETPFETRLVIEDHTRLEQVPREESGPSVASEFEMFRERQREKQSELDKLFADGGIEKRRQEETRTLEEKFKQFRATRQYRPPVGPDSGPSRRDEDED